jgi:DNA polymerase III epsilon subunit-like protein
MKNTVAMIFDVETTGLLRRSTSLDQSPYVLQCSYIVYNMETHQILKTVNSYVKVPNHVVIPPEASAVNGITREKCDGEGKDIREILTEFYKDYHTVNMLIAHNYSFDSAILSVEFRRNALDSCPFALNLFQPLYMKKVGMQHMCTMESSTNMCAIAFPENGKKRSSGGYKWPTLEELYTHLFKKKPDNLHNSIIDCMICLRCVLKINVAYDVTDDAFEEMLLAVL